MAKKPIVQGGVENYLGKQPQVVAPRKWQSSPDAPPTELAYITKAEKDLILKKDIHGSLDKGPNMGPSGIMSLDSFGDVGGGGAAGGDTDAGGGYDTGPGGGGFSGKGPGESDRDFDRRKANERAALQIAERKQARDLSKLTGRDIKERRNIALASFGPLQKYTGRSRFFGGANRFGYTDTLPDGSLKPGFGGRIFGGLLSLLTGIPFVGSAIGSMYDKGTGLFDKTKGFFRSGPDYSDMSEFNRLGLFGLPPGTLDEEDKIRQALTEAELNAYSRFGDRGLPNQNTVGNVTNLNNAFNYNNSVGRFNTDQTVNTNNIMGASRNMVDANQMADYFNNAGITSTNQFNQSPFANADIVDMEENQGFGPMA
tara:strand:+ start:54 stop:1160 length:1107 start_codon:yes stop_codon:yes gene_type:complete